jgi:hypothetical protein
MNDGPVNTHAGPSGQVMQMVEAFAEVALTCTDGCPTRRHVFDKTIDTLRDLGYSPLSDGAYALWEELLSLLTAPRGERARVDAAVTALCGAQQRHAAGRGSS